MRSAAELRDLLHDIDGRGYKAYKAAEGRWSLGAWALSVDHVQGDPFAAPSRVSVRLEPEVAGLDASLLEGGARRLGVAAALARSFADQAREASGRRGSGRSGEIRMEHPGQLVLPQTAVEVEADGTVTARFTVGLPARGRRVLGRVAAELLLDDVPALVAGTLLPGGTDPDVLARAARTNEDAEALRAALESRGLIAFVADGAVLPRRSGVDDRPLEGDAVVPFESPDSLRLELEAPNAGPVGGMGIPRGVTLVVGGGFHGKSTLLRALERGVYNHRPGDGRERVVSHPAAVKIRAEDGRAVAGVDISPFIDGLPTGEDTSSFTTPNASGSTSQAAALVEAVEAGASALLVDEDTAATNFMIRDRRMQILVPGAAEPITPFIDRVREMLDAWGVSSVLVLGGSGDYLDVADTVILMDAFRPRDVTGRAREVARGHPTGRTPEDGPILGPRPRRVPRPGSLDPSRGRRSVSLKVPGTHAIRFGTEDLDLSAVEQLAHRAQTRAVAEALVRLRELLGGGRTLPDALDALEAEVRERGLTSLGPWPTGELMGFRRFELAAALNRIRTLEAEAAP